jgi:hypothetical protein
MQKWWIAKTGSGCKKVIVGNTYEKLNGPENATATGTAG